MHTCKQVDISCKSTFMISGHVLLHTLFKVEFVLSEGMSDMRTGFVGWHYLQTVMYYWRTCCSAGHVFHESMFYGRTCLVGGHVLQEDKSSEKSYIMGTCLMRSYVLQEDMSYSKT